MYEKETLLCRYKNIMYQYTNLEVNGIRTEENEDRNL